MQHPVPNLKVPPKQLNNLLKWYSNEELLEEIQGDLEEEYNEIYATRGSWRANLFYTIEVLRFIRMYRAERKYEPSNHLSMLHNYFKIAFRNLVKHKMYSLINISGLAIGMACAFVIFLFIKVETGYDKFHEKGDNIYRMQHVYGFIGAPVGRIYVEEYPQIHETLRIYPWNTDQAVVLGDEKIFHDDLFLADPNFFTFFSFPLIQGNAKDCLSSTDQIAISKSTAKKYFKDEDPIGKIIRLKNLVGPSETPFTVSAVFEDVPYHSHLQFDMVGSFDIIKKNPRLEPILNNWENDWIATYVLMEPGADTDMITADFEELAKRYEGAENGGPYNFMPLTDLRLESYDLKNDYAEHGNGNQVKVFTAIAIIILLIGCINFTNLATARASKRSREVGIRKALGAFRKQLIYQFYSESAIMTFMALFLALGILVLIIPYLETMISTPLTAGLEDYPTLIAAVAVVVLSTIVFAGSYPALYLSSFSPTAILKERGHSSKSTTWIRRGLVVFQFVISTILIAGSLIIYDQMQFIQKKDLGFQSENMLMFNHGNVRELGKKWGRIKAELEAIPSVSSAYVTSMVPGDNAYYWGYKFEGYTERPHGEGWLGFYTGPDLIKELKIEVLMGRTFSTEIPSDSTAFVLNESAWRQAITSYGDQWKEPIGKKIEYYTTNSGQWALDKSGVVIGVVKDFHHHSLKRPIEPIVIHNFGGSKIVASVDPSQSSDVITFVEDRWQEWGSDSPFTYEFIGDRFNEHYQAEKRFGDFMLIFCLLAIFIACLGLYGLAAYTAEQRNKEIGIRKVLGASVQQIMGMLSKDFLKLVMISIILSTPVAIYAMNKWLENFAFRVDLEWYHFMGAAGFAIVIALITVSSNSIRAANSNPVNSLRHE